MLFFIFQGILKLRQRGIIDTLYKKHHNTIIEDSRESSACDPVAEPINQGHLQLVFIICTALYVLSLFILAVEILAKWVGGTIK